MTQKRIQRVSITIALLCLCQAGAARSLPPQCAAIPGDTAHVISAESAADSTAVEILAPTDSIAEDRSGWIGLPIVFYTPETRLAAGASALYTFRNKGSTRPSTIGFIFFLTQENQIVAAISPELYLHQDRVRLASGIEFSRFPTYFWGVGNDTPDDLREQYTPRLFNLSFSAQKQVIPHVRLGAQYEFKYENIIEVEEDGMLSSGNIPGSDKYIISGAGLLATWDSRDNIFYSTRGSFFNISTYFYPSWLGSDYRYLKLSLDYRKFFPITKKQVVALRGFFNAADGTVPFDEFPYLGGATLMRGYDQGRYRDFYALIFQAEYRLHIWWRIGTVLFASTGQVSNGIGQFTLDGFKYTGGFGFRIRLNDEGLNLRLDYGFAENSAGFYFLVNEAF